MLGFRHSNSTAQVYGLQALSPRRLFARWAGAVGERNANVHLIHLATATKTTNPDTATMTASRALRSALNVRPAGAAAACLRSSVAAPVATAAASGRAAPSLPSIRRRDVASSSRTIASSAPDLQAVPVDTPVPEVRASRGTGQSSGRSMSYPSACPFRLLTPFQTFSARC